jgi:regulator of protease activity HflC (stomatin/prohibitin superfamily)
MQAINIVGADQPNRARQQPCCDRAVNETALWVSLVLLLLVTVVMVPTVVKSFHVVSYDQVAYVKNVYGSVNTDTLYGNGRYFLPLTQIMIRFDNTYEPIAYLATNNWGLVEGIDDSSSVQNAPLSVFLADGVQIHIELFFEYRIDHTRLAGLYNQFGTTYVSQIVAISTATIKSTIAGFVQLDYVLHRDTVENKVAIALESTLHLELGVFAPRNKVKLLQVTFPDSVVSTNLQAVMSLQNNEVALLQQQVTAIETETQRQVAIVTAQRALILSQGHIDANRTVAFAQNFANNIFAGARALGQATFFETLGITNNTIQLEFIKVLNLLDTLGNVTLIQNDAGGSASLHPFINV